MGEMKLIDGMGKKLGFGCMRLPILNGNDSDIDFDTFSKMIDEYMAKGFNYFDTAYPYHSGKSEAAVKKCLVDRYPRDKFYLADKMPVWMTNKEEDFMPIFEDQLERTGAGYFDFYLLHALGADGIKKQEEIGGFDFIQKMKKEGKVRYAGFSFHDSAKVLDEALTNHPEVDFVQLQINYFDWDSVNVQSRDIYEVATKHNVPVIVMEPVKGGTLASLHGEPANILKSIDEKASFASFAIRFAASLPNVFMVLSGMSDEEQLKDNVSYMENFIPLSDDEQAAIVKVREELAKMVAIGCTKCRYCVDDCPKKIMIPSIFTVYNMSEQFGVSAKTKREYNSVTGSERGKASDCIKCGKCEGHCPQHLPIRDLLVQAADRFEN